MGRNGEGHRDGKGYRDGKEQRDGEGGARPGSKEARQRGRRCGRSGPPRVTASAWRRQPSRAAAPRPTPGAHPPSMQGLRGAAALRAARAPTGRLCPWHSARAPGAWPQPDQRKLRGPRGLPGAEEGARRHTACRGGRAFFGTPTPACSPARSHPLPPPPSRRRSAQTPSDPARWQTWWASLESANRSTSCARWSSLGESLPLVCSCSCVCWGRWERGWRGELRTRRGVCMGSEVMRASRGCARRDSASRHGSVCCWTEFTCTQITEFPAKLIHTCTCFRSYITFFASYWTLTVKHLVVLVQSSAYGAGYLRARIAAFLQQARRGRACMHACTRGGCGACTCQMLGLCAFDRAGIRDPRRAPGVAAAAAASAPPPLLHHPPLPPLPGKRSACTHPVRLVKALCYSAHHPCASSHHSLPPHDRPLQLGTSLRGMPEEEIAAQAEELAKAKLEAPKRLRDDVNRDWSEIDDATYRCVRGDGCGWGEPRAATRSAGLLPKH